MGLRLLGRRLFGLAFLSAFVGGLTWPDAASRAEEAAAPTPAGKVAVVVALEELANPAQDEPEDDAAAQWLLRLSGELEWAEGRHLPVSVVERRTLDGGVLSYGPGSAREPELRALALRAGARYVVLAAVTRLADRYSVDVRVLGVEPGPVLLHRVLEAEGASGLAAALGVAAEAVREAVSPPNPEAAPALAEFEATSPSPAPEQRGAQLTPPGPADTAAEAPQAAEPAADVDPRAPRVVEVRVEGNRRIEADAVRAAVATRAGDPLSRVRIGEDVKRIYALGFFRDVQVTAGDAPDGSGTIVSFHVDENPVIRRVSIAGNENLGSDDIKERLTLSVGSTLDYPLLFENRGRIESLYAEKGFYLTKVDYTVEPVDDGSVGVNFDVLEGKKLRLVEVDFDGNQSVSDDDLQKVMQTKEWGHLSLVTHFWDNSGVYAEPVFYQDLDRVAREYMDRGFIRVKVGEPEIQTDDDGLRVRVPIEEGQRYSIGHVDVRGDETMDREQLLALVSLKPGEVFERSKLTSDVETLRAYYADRGFYYAKVEPVTDVDPEALLVSCVFDVQKGELYFVDRIDVHGNNRTRDGVVRRELDVAEGELYSAAAMKRSRARVQRLGFFDEVEVEAKPSDQPRRLLVDVDLVERATGSFTFGAGVGSSNGFMLSASVQQDNLLGRGYGLSAGADLGSVNESAHLRFTNPYLLGSAFSLSSGFSMGNYEYVDFDQEMFGFDLTLGYPLDEGETRAYTGYSWSDREVSHLDVAAASLLQREEFQGATTTSLLSLSARRDTRDDPRFPKEGHSTAFGVEFAGLGGLSNFLRLEGRTTWWIPLKRWLGFESTFVLNSRAGWVLPWNSIGDFDLPGCSAQEAVSGNPATSCAAFLASDSPFGAVDASQVQPLTNIDTDLELPLTERYFLGGIGAFQVRGFESRSLGPRRAILNQNIPVTDVPGDRVFYAVGRNLDGSCIAGPGKCNDLTDREIDDFEDLELADVIGGNKMMLVNFELQFPISEELGLMGIVFLDMGNAFAENESISPADFRFGTGGGVQWFSPFGPILVELGFPLDPLEDEDGSVFEFSLGGTPY